MGDDRHSILTLLEAELGKFGMDVLGAFKPDAGQSQFAELGSEPLIGIMVASGGKKYVADILQNLLNMKMGCPIPWIAGANGHSVMWRGNLLRY